MNTLQVNALLKKKPRMLDDDELRELASILEREVERRHRECSRYLGHPCQEGKRTYAAFKDARAVLNGVRAECLRRGLQPLTAARTALVV